MNKQDWKPYEYERDRIFNKLISAERRRQQQVNRGNKLACLMYLALVAFVTMAGFGALYFAVQIAILLHVL